MVLPKDSIVVRKEGEKKGKKVKHEEISQNCFFFGHYKESQHINILVHGAFMFVFIINQEPKDFRFFFKKSDHGKMPSYMGQLHGP